MARQITYINDADVTALDRLTGIDSLDNSTKNFTIEDIAQLFASTGIADPTKLAFFYNVDNSNASPSRGNLYFESINGVAGFAGINQIIFNPIDNSGRGSVASGLDFHPLRRFAQGNDIKITDVGNAFDGNYAVYHVSQVEEGDGGEVILNVSHLASSGLTPNSEVSLTVLGGATIDGGQRGNAIFDGDFIPTVENTPALPGDIFIREYIDEDQNVQVDLYIFGATSWGEPVNLTGSTGNSISIENISDPGVGQPTTFDIVTTNANEEELARDSITVQPGNDGVSITDVAAINTPALGEATIIRVTTDEPNTFDFTVQAGVQGIQGIQGNEGDSLQVSATNNTALGENNTITITTVDHTGATVDTDIIQVNAGIQGIQGIQGNEGDSLSVSTTSNTDLGENNTITILTVDHEGATVDTDMVQVNAGIQGTQGIQGFQGPFDLDIYQAVAASPGTAPADPTNDAVYDIATKTFTTAPNGGWGTSTAHTSSQILWVLRYRIDPADGATATISGGDWSDPFAAGSQGTQGIQGDQGDSLTIENVVLGVNPGDDSSFDIQIVDSDGADVGMPTTITIQGGETGETGQSISSVTQTTSLTDDTPISSVTLGESIFIRIQGDDGLDASFEIPAGATGNTGSQGNSLTVENVITGANPGDNSTFDVQVVDSNGDDVGTATTITVRGGGIGESIDSITQVTSLDDTTPTSTTTLGQPIFIRIQGDVDLDETFAIPAGVMGEQGIQGFQGIGVTSDQTAVPTSAIAAGTPTEFTLTLEDPSQVGDADGGTLTFTVPAGADGFSIRGLVSQKVNGVQTITLTSDEPGVTFDPIVINDGVNGLPGSTGPGFGDADDGSGFDPQTGFLTLVGTGGNDNIVTGDIRGSQGESAPAVGANGVTLVTPVDDFSFAAADLTSGTEVRIDMDDATLDIPVGRTMRVNLEISGVVQQNTFFDGRVSSYSGGQLVLAANGAAVDGFVDVEGDFLSAPLTFTMQVVPSGAAGGAGSPGMDGLSAYELAFANDSTIGTLQEWLLSLNGENGEDGRDGIRYAAPVTNTNLTPNVLGLGGRQVPYIACGVTTLNLDYVAGQRVVVSYNNDTFVEGTIQVVIEAQSVGDSEGLVVLVDSSAGDTVTFTAAQQAAPNTVITNSVSDPPVDGDGNWRVNLHPDETTGGGVTEVNLESDEMTSTVTIETDPGIGRSAVIPGATETLAGVMTAAQVRLLNGKQDQLDFANNTADDVLTGANTFVEGTSFRPDYGAGVDLTVDDVLEAPNARPLSINEVANGAVDIMDNSTPPVGTVDGTWSFDIDLTTVLPSGSRGIHALSSIASLQIDQYGRIVGIVDTDGGGGTPVDPVADSVGLTGQKAGQGLGTVTSFATAIASLLDTNELSDIHDGQSFRFLRTDSAASIDPYEGDGDADADDLISFAVVLLPSSIVVDHWTSGAINPNPDTYTGTYDFDGAGSGAAVAATAYVFPYVESSLTIQIVI